MRQVAAALAKAAEQGIVHRDIKPENIMLTHSGEVKVADFGLARLVRPSGAVDLTEVGITMGTPLYMSPEQIEGKPLDHRSDVYSFGVTCYHMLAGSPPFEGETALVLAVQHLKKRPPPLEISRPDLPPDLCRMIHKMLVKAPKDRYASTWQLLQDLRQLKIEQFGDQWPEDLPCWEAGTLGGPAAPAAETTQRLQTLMKTAMLSKPQRPHVVRWATAAVAAFLLGGTLAILTSRQPPLLEGAEAQPSSVTRRETVSAQVFYAIRVGTEEAWQAVIKYFPDQQVSVRRAKQQLARIYLRDNKYEDALKIFDELAALGETEEELRAFGLAGKCGVLTLQGKYRQSTAVMDELWPIRARLNDRQIREMLNRAVRKNRDKLGPQTTPQWERWLDEQFREDS